MRLRQFMAITDDFVYGQKSAAGPQVAPDCCCCLIAGILQRCCFSIGPAKCNCRAGFIVAPRDDGIGLKNGLAFVVNLVRPAYAPPRSFETTVEFDAIASGLMSCAANISMTPLKVCRLAAFMTINRKNLPPRYSRGLLQASILGRD